MKQRKINPEVIAALKRVMPDLEIQKMFIDECIKANGKDFENKWSDDIILSTLFLDWNSFSWIKSKNGGKFWASIYKNITTKEYTLKIFLT